jgi:hypothetical protein
LDRYWRGNHVDPTEQGDLQKLAAEIIEEPENLA